MRVRVLGSGAGGGFPQWNCNCANCRGLRSGSLRATARTQSSLALSADGVRWYLINASPDIRQQINAFDNLSPCAIPRDTPIQAILLTNAELDHVAGLLSLRESQPLYFYSTRQVRDWLLESNVVFRALCSSSQRTWKIVSTSGQHELIGADGKDSGLRYQAFAVPGKPPAYLTDVVLHWSEGTIGYKITDARSGRSLAYVPAIKQIDANVSAILDSCDCLFFDGTCWSDDELIVQGLVQKTALSMGHVPISGPDGSLAKLAGLRTARKIYTHMNNTNPLLLEDSPERRTVEEAGWEVAFDGMDFEV
ncbi:MAG TPA: pyrroloquinoline quinone biosynthesis protein PqqB [Candidatus Binatia bacterium]|nr:pyrroloquinoline quinone biosynthesis protein PqqB [Candidatus Binatia bacterium]